MSKPKINDFYRGDSLDYVIEFKNGVTPINIEGWEIYLTLKSVANDPDSKAPLQLKYTVEAGVDATAGKAYIFVKSDYTKGLDTKRHFWDIQIVKPDGIVQTVASGVVMVKRDITQVS